MVFISSLIYWIAWKFCVLLDIMVILFYIFRTNTEMVYDSSKIAIVINWLRNFRKLPLRWLSIKGTLKYKTLCCMSPFLTLFYFDQSDCISFFAFYSLVATSNDTLFTNEVERIPTINDLILPLSKYQAVPYDIILNLYH